jgi:predicted porin
MNKKTAVALAVGAVFSTPALAQSTLEIYGKLYPEVSWTKGSGASADADVTATPVAGDGTVNGNHKGRGSVDVANSYVGFRGQEKLGGSLAAIWQIETRVRFDTGSGGFWANGRNSFLGLQGGFGTVKLGNMDTIYKEYGAVVGNFFGVSSGNFVSSSNVLSANGLGVEGSGDRFDDTGFHIRAPNSIQYQSPEFGGFQAGVQFSPDEAKGNPGREGLNTNLWSFGVKYEAGPLYASVQHERHNDWFDLSANATANSGDATDSKDHATRFSATYAITKQHKLSADFALMEWKESGGAVGDTSKLKKRAWGVGWAAEWGGPWKSDIAYVRNNKGTCSAVGVDCSTDGIEGHIISAGVAYSFSKRTLLFGLASKLTSGKSAIYDQAANFDPNRGEDTTVFALGVSHSF